MISEDCPGYSEKCPKVSEEFQGWLKSVQVFLGVSGVLGLVFRVSEEFTGFSEESPRFSNKEQGTANKE